MMKHSTQLAETVAQSRTLLLSGNVGETVLHVLRGNDVPIQAPCSGRGRCGKCRVVVRRGQSSLSAPASEELEHLSAAELNAGIRLACLASFQTAASIEIAFTENEIFTQGVELFQGEFPEQQNLTSTPSDFVAVDVGTTTISVALFDGASSESVCALSETNQQKSYGGDVISRIEAALQSNENLDRLQRLVVEQIERMILSLCAKQQKPLTELTTIFISGNTTMLHLLRGDRPSGLAAFPFPFDEVYLQRQKMTSSALGMKLLEQCSIELLPCISAFVGADITAGIVATKLQHSDAPELLIDIGTNGEMVLSVDGKLYATATAAGPAFEGGHIQCGCPGIPGALDRAGWSADGGHFWHTTIHDIAIVGICGSGLVDCVASLLRAGQIDDSGELLLPDDQDLFYPQADADIFLSQADIRQIQLAKGSIAAGITVLCEKAGVEPDAIRTVYLAGGFGTFLKETSAIDIGLLPQCFASKVKPMGNSALAGTLLYAADQQNIELQMTQIRAQIESLDLSKEPSFQDEFIENMMFPEDFL